MKRRLFIFLLIFMLLIPQSAFATDSKDISPFSNKVLQVVKNISKKYSNIPSSEVPEKKEQKTIPVLMFHQIGYLDEKEYDDSNYILKHGFETKMLYMSAHGYTTITMAELHDHWVNGTELPEKPVVLTFDDGYATHFTMVKSVLERFNAKGTFYIVQDRLFMGMEGRNLEGLKKLAEAGQEIGVHTYSHPDFTNMTYDEIYKEVSTCKNFLEDNLNIKVKTFSYPYGNYNDAAVKVLKDLDFDTAVTTKEGRGNINEFEIDSIYKISRHNIDINTDEVQFKRILEGK